MYAEPIFSQDGGFPKELVQRVAQKSKEQGFAKSRLPEFTEHEKIFVKGTSDFFGVNHYTAFLVSANEHKENFAIPSLLDDMDNGLFVPDEWLKSASPWLTVSLIIFNIIFTLNIIYIGSTVSVNINNMQSVRKV